MNLSFRVVLRLVPLLVICGCHVRDHLPDTGHHDFTDWVFGQRHTKHLPEHLTPHSMYHLAEQVTQIEDAIRRDGSITVKQPDVWSDGNLIHFIQEYDRLMAESVDDFEATLQAYIARSDAMEVQSATALGLAASNSDVMYAPAGSRLDSESDDQINLQLDTPELIDLEEPNIEALVDLVNKLALSGSDSKGIGVEPTELERQKSTYINVNQALRRRNMGGDNARAAGYGLYKFRLPVSVIPGRETSSGYMAVANLRAKMRIDEAHLRATFPKLVIADLVNAVAPKIRDEWGDPLQCSCEKVVLFDDKTVIGEENRSKTQNDVAPKATAQTPIIGAPNETDLQWLRAKAEAELGTPAPKTQDLRSFLFKYLAQVQIALEERELYLLHQDVIAKHADEVKSGQDLSALRDRPLARGMWQNRLSTDYEEDFIAISWLVASQAGVADLNIKRILEELYRQGKLGEEDYHLSQSDAIYFFAPDLDPLTTLTLWRTMIEENFPIHVFALDPQVEEQNAFDALNRRRELQLALAISVAQGGFGLNQRLAASRLLGLDIATIDLNRTIVGFTHGNDTFGWYFRPRVQAPPTESTNIGALARTLWSTGPTERYDLKNRELEPGIRECEVIVVMPSFVTRVDFDVTTNWENLTKPGKTKRSYEEMLALGSRLHRLRTHLQECTDQHCFRPGDFERLLSRLEQLESMLALQTHTCDVPYGYDVSATELFDKGDVQLKPQIDDYYGLKFLVADDESEAHFFLSGRNFHPTLTHVIIGGSESHTIEPGRVEVINRELLKVEVHGLDPGLSASDAFQVRVGTPAGLSNGLEISRGSADSATADQGWKHGAPTLNANYCISCENKQLVFPMRDSLSDKIEFDYEPDAPPMKPDRGQLVIKLRAEDGDGNEVTVNDECELNPIDLNSDLSIPTHDLLDQISSRFSTCAEILPPSSADVVYLKGTMFVRFDCWPVEQVTNELEIRVNIRRDCGDSDCDECTANAQAIRPAEDISTCFTIGDGVDIEAVVTPKGDPADTGEAAELLSPKE